MLGYLKRIPMLLFIFEDRVLSDVVVERHEREESVELVMKDAKTGFGSKATIPKVSFCKEICEEMGLEVIKLFDGVAKSLVEQKLKSIPDPKVIWIPPEDPSFVNVLKYPLPVATVGKLWDSFKVWLGKPSFSFIDMGSPSITSLAVYKEVLLFKLRGKRCGLHDHLLERLLKALPESKLSRDPYSFMDRLYGNDFFVIINKNVKMLEVPNTLKECLEKDEVDPIRPTSLLTNMLLNDTYPSFVTEVEVNGEVRVTFDDGSVVKAKIKDSKVIIEGDVKGYLKLSSKEGRFTFILEEELGLSGLSCSAEVKVEAEGLEDLWKASIAFWSALKLLGREMVLEKCSLGGGRRH